MLLEQEEPDHGAMRGAMSLAVSIAIRDSAPDFFLGWMRDHGGRFFSEAFGLAAPPEAQRALGACMGRMIWNHLPHPDHHYAPKKLPDLGRNDPCPCGSGRKYKHCCAEAARGLPPISTETLLAYVLAALPQKAIKVFPRDRFSPELLASIAGEWMEQGEDTRVLALLEPLFADPARLDHRHAPAFDVLMNLYLDLGKPRKRKALLETGLKAADAHLRGTARQRQAAALFDQGDTAGAWESLHLAMRDNPDDPSLALLEMTLLQAEGRTDQLRERARFWLTRLQRQPQDEVVSDVVAMLRQVMDNPDALVEQYMAGALPEFEALARKLASLPPLGKPARLKVYEDGEAVWPENRKLPLDEWLELMEFLDLEGALEWLEENPTGWDCPDVLNGLAYLGNAESLPQSWTDRMILAPIYERARALFDAARKGVPFNAPLPWGWLPNRAMLRLLAGRADWLMRQGNRAEALLAWAELLRLNPGDNQGVREAYSGALLEDGQYNNVLALNKLYPDDFCWLTYDKVVALYALGKKDEALNALGKADKAFPKVLKMLVAQNPKQPKEDKYGVALGGQYEAWLYRESRLGVWEKTGALAWARGLAERR